MDSARGENMPLRQCRSTRSGCQALHVLKVAVDRVHIRIFECGSDPGRYMLMCVKVIGVQKAHDVASGQSNSLVESIVDAAIGLGHEDADRLASSKQYG